MQVHDKRLEEVQKLYDATLLELAVASAILCENGLHPKFHERMERIRREGKEVRVGLESGNLPAMPEEK